MRTTQDAHAQDTHAHGAAKLPPIASECLMIHSHLSQLTGGQRQFTRLHMCVQSLQTPQNVFKLRSKVFVRVFLSNRTESLPCKRFSTIETISILCARHRDPLRHCRSSAVIVCAALHFTDCVCTSRQVDSHGTVYCATVPEYSVTATRQSASRRVGSGRVGSCCV